jgi:hypothetical protein
LKILTSLIPPNAFFSYVLLHYVLQIIQTSARATILTTLSVLLDTLSNSGPDPQRQRHHLSVG